MLRLDTLIIGLVVLVAAALVFYPMVFLVISSLNVGDPTGRGPIKLGLDNYAVIGKYLDWLLNSFMIAIPGTMLAVLLGTVLAWIVNRTTIPWRGFFDQMMVIPYYLPPIVGALAWSLLGAERTGIINVFYRAIFGATDPLVNTHSPLGIIFAMAIFDGTVAFIMISAAMKSMDPALEESSTVLGAGRFYTAARVTVPLLIPAVLGSGILIFAEMMGSFSIPAILGMNVRFFVVTTGIYSLLTGFPPNYAASAALGLSLFVFTAGSVYLYGRILKGGNFVTITGKAFRPRLVDMGRWTPLLFAVCVTYLMLAVILPLGALIYASFLTYLTTTAGNINWTLDNYNQVIFGYGPARVAIRNSFMLGLLTASIGVVFMGLLSWIMYRTSIKGRGLLEYVVMFPQAVPRMVLALGLLWAWLVVPIGIYGTIWILLLAYLTVFLPIGVRSITSVILQIDKSLEECARVCGASWLRTLRTITMPLLRPGLMSAWVLLFIVALREISTSILLVTGKNMVLGPSIFVFYEMGGLAAVSALAVILSAIIFAALIVVRLVAGKSVIAE